MALLWADGFDHYGDNAQMLLAGWTSGGIGPQKTNVRTGDYSYKFLKNNGQFMQRAIKPSTTVIYGFARLDLATVDTQWRTGSIVKNATKTIGVYVILGGVIAIYDGDTILAQSDPNVFVAGSYNFIECKVFSHATLGTIEVRRNGLPIASLPVLTNRNTGGTPFNVFSITGQINQSTYSDQIRYFDDLYIFNDTGPRCNDFAGDIRCRTGFALSNGPLQDWAANNPPAFGEIDNLPPTPTTNYIYTPTVGAKSNFGHTQVPLNTAYISGVMVYTSANKTDSGACEITPQISSNGTEASGTPISPGTGTAWYAAAFETDPDTGQTWSRAGYNAALIQAERTA